MLKLKTIWHGAVFTFAGLLVASAVGIQVAQHPTVIAQSGTCNAGTIIVNPGPGQLLSGEEPVEAFVPPGGQGTTNPVDHVEFYSGNFFIDDAEMQSPDIWEGVWDTELLPNGPRPISAELYDDQSNLICETAPVMVTIQNSTSTAGDDDDEFRLVRLEPSTLSWHMIPHWQEVFKVRAIVIDENGDSTVVTPQTNFNWTLDGFSVGSIRGDTTKSFVEYLSGPVEGDARLIVNAQYLDQADQIIYDIFVSQDDGNFPELDDDEIDLVTDGVDETELDPDVEDEPTPEERLVSDAELRDCLIDVVGEIGYDGVVSGQRRLNFSELDQADRCFAVTRYIIPANAAPVEPSKIRELREDRRLANIDAVEQAENANDREGILLRGTSTPNTTILLYIFSEPLVLTTTTDENGNWTYVLEDPLEPGEHEVFVAVEDDNGDVVRSSAFTFNVAQAASIETNPSGLSLTLDLSDPTQNSTIYYVSGVAAVVLVGLGLYVFVVRRKTDLLPDDVDHTKDKAEKK